MKPFMMMRIAMVMTMSDYKVYIYMICMLDCSHIDLFPISWLCSGVLESHDDGSGNDDDSVSMFWSPTKL